MTACLNGLINSTCHTTCEELLQKASTQIAVIITYLVPTSSKHFTYSIFNPLNKHAKKVFKEEIICPKARSYLSHRETGSELSSAGYKVYKVFVLPTPATFQLCRINLSAQTWSALSFPLWKSHEGCIFVSQPSVCCSIFWTSRQAAICTREHLVGVE